MSRKSFGRGQSAQQAAPPENNEPVIELESQFLLRLPEEPAAALKAALRAGATNIKERLSIQLSPENPADPRLRKGIVEFDSWNMSAKLVDLPTIIESHKTIDKKTFYKTADISQMLMCKEGELSDEEEPEVSDKSKKYDPNKVDKRYVYLHGITPPLKNCRKNRFRKTLKKRYIDAPENEKEVKHLLRQDLDAVRFSYELITEEEVKGAKQSGESSKKKAKGDKEAAETPVDENLLFGALSDSDDEPELNTTIASEGESNTFGGNEPGTSKQGPTQFSSEMFHTKTVKVEAKVRQLQSEVEQIKREMSEIQANIDNCDNYMLSLRFRASLETLEANLRLKEEELEDLS